MTSTLSRRDLFCRFGKVAMLAPICALTLFETGCGGATSSPVGPPAPETDEALLDEIQRAAFSFFFNEASAATGLVKDRAHADGGDSYTVSSIAATGFGLTALCIGDQRGYADSASIATRVKMTLTFLLNQMPHENGFFYHFVDMNSGARALTSEVSSIDSAILMCGILTCRQHFADPAIADLATQLYERVDWAWMLDGGATLSLGWTPESGFLAGRWDTYNELMMLYLLAMGSPTHPIPAASWQAWTRPMVEFQGLSYIAGASPLFIHQYSHAWFDFRNESDAFANYFENSIVATQAHKEFCVSLAGQFADYTDNFWGITSSDSINGYVAWGGPPGEGPIDGTVVPCAVAGSLPFVSAACLAVLHNMRSNFPLAWKTYGFVDAFNPLSGWYDVDVVGIDVGISMLMAENQRTGFVWQTFMKNAEVNQAMVLAGFH
jgi:hypothetical protein